MKYHVNYRRAISMTALSTSILALTACVSFSKPELKAQAQLEPTRGNGVTGLVSIVQVGHEVRVRGEIRGLKPNAEFGFHVHEKGDCSSGDGMSTGGHFNPDGKSHGMHGHAAGYHVGDLPSLKSNANGVASFQFTSHDLSLGQAANSVVGRGLIVHRDPDDYKTQPTGNSGPRTACAVIQKI